MGWWAGGLVGCSSSLGLGAGQGWAKVRLAQDPVFGAVLSPPNIPTFTAAYPWPVVEDTLKALGCPHGEE